MLNYLHNRFSQPHLCRPPAMKNQQTTTRNSSAWILQLNNWGENEEKSKFIPSLASWISSRTFLRVVSLRVEMEVFFSFLLQTANDDKIKLANKHRRWWHENFIASRSFVGSLACLLASWDEKGEKLRWRLRMTLWKGSIDDSTS